MARPRPPATLAPQTYTRNAAGRGATASGTEVQHRREPREWRAQEPRFRRLGSRSRSGGQRAPRPQARPAPAPRHPPAALAPARDSCTDMKRGPCTPKKPAPANQRRAPPSLRPPLAAPATPGPPDSRTDPQACPPPPAGPLPAPSRRPLLPVPPAGTLTPPADCCAPSCGRSWIRLTPRRSSQLLTNWGPPPRQPGSRTLWASGCPLPRTPALPLPQIPPPLPLNVASWSPNYLPRLFPPPTRAMAEQGVGRTASRQQER